MSNLKHANGLLLLIGMGTLLVLVIMGGGSQRSEIGSGRPVDVAEIEPGLAENDLVLIKFGATWCPPCREVEKELDSLEPEKLGVKIVKVDTDERTDLSKKYQIDSIPHLMLVRGGKSLSEMRGSQSASQLTQWIKKYD